MAEGTRELGKLVVFISYSRDDLDFADQLDAALQLYGFTTTIDRHGISGGEEWKRRLGNLIRDADTVLFVLSPSSAESPVCKWEAEEAVRLGKRIVPVVCRTLDSSRPPSQLADLNYVIFYPDPDAPGSGFGTGLGRLVAALSTDLEWLREHTRLLQRATEWQTGGQPANRLLSGGDIAAAKAWAARRPKDAPEPTELHLDFVRESEIEEERRQNQERQRLEQMQAAQTERAKALAAAEAAQSERAKALAQSEAASRREAEASRRAAEESQHAALQSKRVAQRTLVGLAAALVLAALAGYYWYDANKQRKTADNNAELAGKNERRAKENEALARENEGQAKKEARRAVVQASRYLAALATAELKDNDPVTALALGLEAFKGEGAALNDIAEDIRAEGAIHQALVELKEKATLTLPVSLGTASASFAAFDPTGEQIVTVDSNRAILWDAKRLVPLEPSLDIRTKITRDTPASPMFVQEFALFGGSDGRTLLTIDSNGTAKLWNASERSLVAQLPEVVSSAVFAAKGTRIVTLSSDSRSAAVWRLDGTPAMRTRPPADQRRRLRQVVTGEAGKTIVTHDDLGRIEIWRGEPSASPAEPVGEILVAGVQSAPPPTPGSPQFVPTPLSPVSRIVISRDETKLIVVLSTDAAEVWDVEQRARLHTIAERGVTDAAFDPAARRLVLGTSDGTVRVVEIDAGPRRAGGDQALRGLQGRVESVTFSPDGQYIAAGAGGDQPILNLTPAGGDQAIRVWDTRAQPIGNPIVLRSGGRVTPTMFSSDGRTVVTARTGHGGVTTFDIGLPIPKVTLPGSDLITTPLEIADDGRYMLYGAERGVIKVWSVHQQGMLKELEGGSAPALALALAPNGGQLLVLRENGEGELWTVGEAGGTVVKSVPNIVPAPSQNPSPDPAFPSAPDAFFAPNGKFIAVVGNGKLTLWDASLGSKLLEQEAAAFVGASGFSADGQKLVFSRVSDGDTAPVSPLAPLTPRIATTWLFEIGPGKLSELFKGRGLSMVGFVENDEAILAFEESGGRGSNVLIWSTREQRKLLEWNDFGGDAAAPALPDGWSADRILRDVLRLFHRSILSRSPGSQFDLYLPAREGGMDRMASGRGLNVEIVDGRGMAQALQRGVTKNETFARLARYLLPYEVRSVVFADEGRLLAIAGNSEPVQLWQAFPSTRDLVEHARQVVPRCLTRDQRNEAYLDEEPPEWCIRLGKWPYHTEQWKAWLAGGKKGPMPGRDAAEVAK